MFLHVHVLYFLEARLSLDHKTEQWFAEKNSYIVDETWCTNCTNRVTSFVLFSWTWKYVENYYFVSHLRSIVYLICKVFHAIVQYCGWQFVGCTPHSDGFICECDKFSAKLLLTYSGLFLYEFTSVAAVLVKQLCSNTNLGWLRVDYNFMYCFGQVTWDLRSSAVSTARFTCWFVRFAVGVFLGLCQL